MRVVNEHHARAGKKLMYACNITDEIDDMPRRHDRVPEGGVALADYARDPAEPRRAIEVYGA